MIIASLGWLAFGLLVFIVIVRSSKGRDRDWWPDRCSDNWRKEQLRRR